MRVFWSVLKAGFSVTLFTWGLLKVVNPSTPADEQLGIIFTVTGAVCLFLDGVSLGIWSQQE